MGVSPLLLRTRHFVHQHRRFIEAFVRTGNATESVMLATGETNRQRAAVAGGRLLKRKDIQAAVQALQLRVYMDDDNSAQRVLEELRRLAYFDQRSLYDASGNLRPVTEWTVEQGAAVVQCEVVSGNGDVKDGKRDRLIRLKFADKLKALEMLAKHHALLVERTEVSGGITVSWLPAHDAAATIDQGPPDTPRALPPALDGEVAEDR